MLPHCRQWGVTESIPIDSRVNVTFPVALSSACYSVVVSYIAGTVQADHVESYGVANVTLTGFEVENQYTVASVRGAFPAYWLALGI